MSLDALPTPSGATISLFLADGRPAGDRRKDKWNGMGIDCSHDLVLASEDLVDAEPKIRERGSEHRD
jgi:hypothetical protein